MQPCCPGLEAITSEPPALLQRGKSRCLPPSRKPKAPGDGPGPRCLKGLLGPGCRSQRTVVRTGTRGPGATETVRADSGAKLQDGRASRVLRGEGAEAQGGARASQTICCFSVSISQPEIKIEPKGA